MKNSNRANLISSNLKPAFLALCLALVAGSSAFAGTNLRPSNSTIPTPSLTSPDKAGSAVDTQVNFPWWWLRTIPS